MTALRRSVGWSVAQLYRLAGRRSRALRAWLSSGAILPVVFHDAAPREVEAMLAWLVSHGGTPRNLDVTFDDGWAAFEETLPVLEAFGLPVTLFVAPGETERGHVWTNEAMEAGVPAATWRAWYALDASERLARLEAAVPARPTRRLLSPEAVCRLARHPLVTLGNHTWSHMSCPHRPLEEALGEIDRAQRELTRWSGGRAPVAFAYPFGRGTPALDAAVRARGLVPHYTRPGLVAAATRGAARNVFVEGATLAENAGRLLSAWPPIGTTR